jgi:hypothetical protein
MAGKNLAYYFSDWIWKPRSVDLMKSMLLFFDGLTLALPTNLAARMVDEDPILATPLVERGLLVNFDPATTLDADSAECLAVTLTELLEHHPGLWRANDKYLQLAAEHWGAGKARYAAVAGFERALFERGLITPRLDGLFDLSLSARLLVLTVFAQSLRLQLAQSGIKLHCATDSDRVVGDVIEGLMFYESSLAQSDLLMVGDIWGESEAGDCFYLWRPVRSMEAGQLADDLLNVGADLSAVPLDEVLDFRRENGRHYRAYAKALRDFVISQSQVGPAEHQRAQVERAEEIHDQAAELRHISRVSFGARTAALLISIGGAAWTLKAGDPIGALLAGTSAAAQALPVPAPRVTEYSYLFGIRDLT